jgi:hypothetical protein
MELVFTLLLIFQAKHFIADYPLQGKYMLGKFKADWSFFLPLLAHAGVHAAFTLAIALYFKPGLWWLSLVDLVVHFCVDRIKAGPKYLGRFKDMYEPIFWHCLGLDQMAHHLTHYWFIYMLMA